MDDEMDDVLRRLENGENPLESALQEEKEHDKKTAAIFRVISIVSFSISAVSLVGGALMIGNTVIPVIGAIAGGALLAIAASAWAVSLLHKDDN